MIMHHIHHSAARSLDSFLVRLALQAHGHSVALNALRQGAGYSPEQRNSNCKTR